MNALDDAFDDATAGDVFVADPSAWFPPPTDQAVDYRLGWTAALDMVRRLGAPGLTDDEHNILERLDEIAADIEALAAPDDPSPASWLPHLVAIQQAIMANAAARTHPTRYRLLGGGTA